MENEVLHDACFVSNIYYVDAISHLKLAKKLTKEYLSNSSHEIDKTHPVKMSDNFAQDERIKPLKFFILNSILQILNQQGYDLRNGTVHLLDMWGQEHHTSSGMDYHVHPSAIMSGFYFLDCPNESSRLIFHDPRSAKVFSNLPELHLNNLTSASNAINYVPKPGMLIFANSWLPHSLTRNRSDDEFRFIHFNVGVTYAPPSEGPEII
jgi:uncharacterized protein (TIGR02466 family)